ncbi:hypothetical protein L198_00214 [Cryptococcus wingfieldii CBS 7118]|uniref:CBM21 domain-containing protein n=1 Tax=Cryptococcus wingfieldii CBS 7118 TaxID=1295528 RepID=A0A1E3K5N2_9TREE|nr:hypothetical protein L198_00214 [Cryptococcus wingfieldii CBS 7118]ODO08484.1 hypothetical protein L198_00214 [Cryptococcus wingfieldii CBS 7118]
MAVENLPPRDTLPPTRRTSRLRLRESHSLLASLCRSRVLETDTPSPLMDAFQFFARPSMTNDGQDVGEMRLHGLRLNVGDHKSDDAGSIFVSPPTPDRVESPSDEVTLTPPPSNHPVVRSSTPLSMASSIPAFVARSSPLHSPLSSAPSSPGSVSIPLHVFPEVRSPPKKTLAMAADSLTIAAKRGRRSKLFGFTEIPGSNFSSATSSAASSPDNTPLVKPRAVHRATASVPTISTPLPPPATSASAATSPQMVPRRHPSTVAHTPPIHLPPRRRPENGLKLNLDAIPPISDTPAIHTAIPSTRFGSALIRKKSGQVLKSALKQHGGSSGAATPMDEGRAMYESKSCPSTPSALKFVHFDSHLERIKLFVHDQKPLVVSRDGSPLMEDEGDDYPFGDMEEERKVLQISLPNFPTYHDPQSDLYLESIFLNDDRQSLRGVIICKNLSFQKWVAVRFTFDWWQTTSEVTGVFKESVKGGQYDRFTFTIKLGDLIPKIEQKTLFIAARYNVNGREIWDSNGGQNYQVLFTKNRPARQPTKGARDAAPVQPGMGKAVGGKSSQWSVAGGDDRMADLRAKLDRLKDDDDRPPLSPNSSRNFSFNNKKASPRASLAPLEVKAADSNGRGGSLAARYDFGASLNLARRNSNSPLRSPVPLPEMKTGLLSFDAPKRPSSPAATTFYSPKFDQDKLVGDSNVFTSPRSNAKAVPVPGLKVEGPSPEGPSPEPIAPSLTPKTRTPPSVRAAKVVSTQPPLVRTISAPPKFTIGEPEHIEDNSMGSPPSLDSSSTATATPPESPRSPYDNGGSWSPRTSEASESSTSLNSMSSMASYSSLIEHFCWAGDPSLDVTRRNHSTSELDDYFGHPSSGFSTPRAGTPAGGASAATTPSSTSTYYTSYASNTPTREDLDAVENSLEEGFGRRVGQRPMVF